MVTFALMILVCVISLSLGLVQSTAAESNAAGDQLITEFGSPDSWVFTGENWSLKAGQLVQSDVSRVNAAFLKTPTFGDASIRVAFRVKAEGRGVRTAGLILRSIDSQRGYFVHYDTRNDQIILMRGDPVSPYGKEIARRMGLVLEDEKWYTAKVDITGTDISIYLNGDLALAAKDDTYQAGCVGLYTSQGHAEFKDLQVQGKAAAMSSPWKADPRDEVPYNQSIATILETRVLCKQPGRYIGWPSIAIAGNGDLLAVFSGDRDAHVSPDGKTQMVRSSDGGKTWSEAITINNLPVDNRDAGIVLTKNGTLVVSFFTGPPYHTEIQGNYVIRSTDNGHTWGKPIRTEVTTPHGPIQLSDGRLLFIGLRPHCSHTTPRNYNGPPADSPHTISIEESRDDGCTWNVISKFPVPKNARMLSFDEPHIVETSDGEIVAQFRDCNEPGRLWQSESSDGGLTWSEPYQTALHGHPPHLLRLNNGWLLSTYGKRHANFGEYACISKDNGKTWDVDNEVRLSSAPSSDLGYPASAQLCDGSIWTVYYEIDRIGEKPCLKGTHWRIK